MQKQNKEEEHMEGFQRLSDQKLLKALVITMVVLGYAFIFVKVVFLN